MKQVLLVNPPWLTRRDNIWRSISSVNPPIGLAGIASFLETRGVKVRVLDMHALGMSVRELGRIANLKDYQVVGITCTTPLLAASAQIVKSLREIVPPEVKVVLGGVHPTVAADECLAIHGVDYVVRGEGEESFLQIVENRPPEDIPGISFRRDGHVAHNQPGPLIKELDTLPLPAYHLLPMRAYRPAIGAFRQLPGTGTITSRGCPGRCTFCYRIFGSSLRLRSAGHIMEEIRLLRNTYGIREISFYDDTFTASRKRVAQLCEMLLKEQMGVTWSCFARVDTVDRETLLLMKRAGCHQIMYGFEAASGEILAAINKRTDLERAMKAVEWTKEAKIDIRAAFMIGSPGETEETLEETYRLAVRIDPEIVVFNITTPFPGTEMFGWAKRNGHLLTDEWRDYDLAHPVMNLPTISAVEVKRAYRRMYVRFYLRPGYVLRRAIRMSSWAQLKALFRAAFGIMGLR